MTSESRVRDWLRLLRPHQWIKNGFVLAPLLFSGKAFQLPDIRATLLAFAAFCLAASATYVVNDTLDRTADRLHPSKRFRPLAAGLIGSRQASVVAAALAILALALGWTVRPSVAVILLFYLGLSLAYSLLLKRIPIIDVFAIAAFYIIRLVAGAQAIDVVPTIWLLTCGGLLALYLGFAKRRHELLLLGDSSSAHRAVLSDYSPSFLDQASVVLLSVTIVAYLMYTVSSETAADVGSELLSYSLVFVLYGVFRYLYLVNRQEAGGSPTETLLTDRPLLTSVVGWLLYCGWVIYRPF